MYSKLFSSILNSSIWSEDSDTCKVWVTLLAMQDREGYIFGSPAGIARIAALPPVLVDSVITRFCNPDPDSADLSRNPDNEGRRLEIVPGGWHLLNAEYYNGLADSEDRREQNRLAQQRHREKVRGRNQVSSAVNGDPSASVNGNQPSEVDADVKEEPPSIPPRGGREGRDRKSKRFRETDVGKGEEELEADRIRREGRAETARRVRELSRGALRKM